MASFPCNVSHDLKAQLGCGGVSLAVTPPTESAWKRSFMAAPGWPGLPSCCSVLLFAAVRHLLLLLPLCYSS